MPQDSKRVRQLRRLKRERSIAFKMADVALKQRDEARALVNAFGQMLQKGQDAGQLGGSDEEAVRGQDEVPTPEANVDAPPN